MVFSSNNGGPKKLVMGWSIGIGKYRFIFEVSVYIGIGQVESIGILVSVLNILYRYRYYDKLLKPSNLNSYFN